MHNVEISFHNVSGYRQIFYPMLQCRDVKASGLYFLVYSFTLDGFKVGETGRENTGPEIFLAGGMAGRNHSVLDIQKD